MKTERLIVLVSPEEKARVERLAKRQCKSVGELVRNALSDFEAAQDAGGKPNGMAPVEDAELSAEQKAALERLAETALSTMQRANAALDKAFEAVEETKAQLAEQRAKKRTASA